MRNTIKQLSSLRTFVWKNVEINPYMNMKTREKIFLEAILQINRKKWWMGIYHILKNNNTC